MSDFTKKRLIYKAFAFLFVIAVLVILDQWTKRLAVASLKGREPFVIIQNVLEFSYLENRGAAFGMMQGMRIAFLIFAPAVSIGLFAYGLKLSLKKKFTPAVICFLLIISGAIGNFIDRLRNGYVVDFIYFKLIDFPVFNVADIFVTCGAILLILLLLFKYKEEDFD